MIFSNLFDSYLDTSLKTGSPLVIFAMGQADPSPGSDIEYHGLMRGVANAVLVDSSQIMANGDNVQSLNITTMDFSIQNVTPISIAFDPEI